MKRLLVNADDFGLCQGITDGIVAAHRHGIVTSTSIMAPADGFGYAVEQARDCPGLKIGVHLTLVEERPLCEPKTIPTLVTKQHKLPASYTALLSGIVTGRIQLTDIDRELRAQVNKCVAVGLQPTHLDSHQHVHALPMLLRVVLKIAQDYGIPGLRLPRDSPRWRGSSDSSQFPQKLALCWLARWDGWRLRHPGIVTCDQMAGLFDSGSLTEARLLNILDRLPDGTTELVSHPGEATAEALERYGHWNYNWGAELAALQSPRVRERIQESGIELISYQDLSQWDLTGSA